MLAHDSAIEAGEVDRKERTQGELCRAAEVRCREDDDGLRDVIRPVAGAGVRPVDHQHLLPMEHHVLWVKVEVQDCAPRANCR
jgi:hypothetical protein